MTWDLRSRDWGLGLRGQGSRVWGFGREVRVQGCGLWVQGVEFRV
jgi:hypothetical protein